MKFTNSTEKLLIKKSLVVFLAILLLLHLLFKLNIQLIISVTIGYVVSIFRLRSLSEMVKTAFINSKGIFRLVITKYFLVQIFTIIILLISVVKSINIFFAISAGIIIIPLTIMFNAFTETIGLTKNNFE